MRIAICDDEHITAKELEHITKNAFENTSYNYTSDVFFSGDDLIAHLKKKPLDYQMYILDIEMPGTDGLSVAQYIRKKDEDAVIIFVTNHAELMPEAFKVLAFQYIVKPFDEQVASDIILSAAKLLENRRVIFSYEIRKRTHTIYLSQIAYFESISRKIIIHTIDGDCVEFYGAIKDVEKKVAGLMFARPHTSFIVNMEKIKTIDRDYIILRNGYTIKISNKFRKTFHMAYLKFIEERAK